MNNIISVRLMGGLGNQLFQLFTIIAYSIENSYDFVFPYVDKLTSGTVRNTYWETFLVGLRQFTPYNKDIKETNESLLQMCIFNEPYFRFNKLPKLVTQRTLFVGYYQSYKYFDKYWNNISNMIGLKRQQNQIKLEYSDLLSNKETVSMHFRMGDYVNIQHCHPIMPYNYYYNALCNLMMNKNIDYRVLYFCQDVDNSKVFTIINKLKRQFPSFEFVKVDDTIEDWKQLLIMSNCNHNIIANSTYSWWGAWFNSNENKKVFYPHLWFGPALPHNTDDLFPKDWMKIYW